ncbi:TerB family tellurite resistance protein [uncultured Rhodoblastus sp.]|uniref:tellurite resistance TerB family protein n=1 Tax=uncultured Rhodoblastus sp. TaxID=543037 RepID=UPI0025FFDEDB|nr:TerB family tellurite resistance protein [uncultured Rhodoblastus sp.]
MFDKLRRFIEEVTGPDPAQRDFEADELRVASAALLVHVAEIDGFFSAPERRSLLLLLQQRYDLDAEAARELLDAGQKSDREAVDLYQFTSALVHAMSLPERRRLIEMMWTIAYADGELQEFEENIVWRVSELLGVPARDRIALRQKIRAESGRDPQAPEPWETEAAESEAGDAENGKARP